MTRMPTTLIAALALGFVTGGCTLLKGEYSSTSTEYKDESGVSSRLEAVESRLDRVERTLDRIEKKVDGSD